MIDIIKFPYRSRCEVNMCKERGVWSVGEANGPKSTRIIYCDHHLKELAKAVIAKFPEEFPTGNVAEIEKKDKKIEELTQALAAKAAAHECLKEQVKELREMLEDAKQKGKTRSKSQSKTSNKKS